MIVQPWSCECEHIDHICGMNNNCQNISVVKVKTIEGWFKICSECYKNRHMAYPHTEYLDTHMEP